MQAHHTPLRAALSTPDIINVAVAQYDQLLVDPGQVKASLGMGWNVPLVLFVGRLALQKVLLTLPPSPRLSPPFLLFPPSAPSRSCSPPPFPPSAPLCQPPPPPKGPSRAQSSGFRVERVQASWFRV
eukprot:253076-Rhodomonas_salina.1